MRWGDFQAAQSAELRYDWDVCFLNCFVSLETSPKSGRFLDCESRPLSAFTFCVSLQVCPFFFSYPNTHNGIDRWCSWNCCEIGTSIVSAVMRSVSKNVVEDFFFLRKNKKMENWLSEKALLHRLSLFLTFCALMSFLYSFQRYNSQHSTYQLDLPESQITREENI